MSPNSSVPQCQNSQCPENRSFWLRRLRRPKGIWFNKKWYCSLECLEEGTASVFSRFNLKNERNPPARYRLPLGLLMLSKGLISSEHLQQTLKAQRESQRGRFGEWLRTLGIVTEDQLTAMLGMQWGYPVFHLAQSPGFSECANMVPLHILEFSRMAPVHVLPISRTLYIAFSDGIDFSALRGLEQMLDYGTQPCVIGDAEMTEALEAIGRMDRPSEIVIDCPSSAHELAHVTRDWAASNHAEHIRAVNCPGCLWVRIDNASVIGHLIFKFQEVAPAMAL
ncbi:MAG: hypothetical protein ACRD2B_12275 [Terriglobia bacterium]